MKSLTALLENAKELQQGLSSGSLIGGVLAQHGNDILELQKIQLLEGKSSSGADLHPYYTEDLKPQGRFYTVQTARNYAGWKSSLQYPYSVERNPDAPNLYVNGKFHSELRVQFSARTVLITGSTPYSQKIISKYGLANFGLCAEKWNALMWEKGVYDQILEQAKTIMYGY